jgi:hypothetical protein
MLTRETRWRRALLEHLESPDVTRVIYGSIIGLALVVAFQFHPVSAGKTTAFILGTAIAIGLAELYSDIIGTETRTRQPVNRSRVRQMAREAGAATFGAAFPAIFFILVSVGVIGMPLAFRLAKWTGLGLICAYGYVASRLAGETVGKALFHAAFVGAIAGALIAFKAFLH